MTEDNNIKSQLPRLGHEYFCKVWESIKSGEPENLTERGKIVGKLMLEHPEYQHFWEVPYSFAEHEIEVAFEEGGVNPDLHLESEIMIVEQVEKRDPPEIYEAYKALLAIGVDEHGARHVIGRVFFQMVWEGYQMLQKGKKPDEDFYLRRLRSLATNPKKVMKKQTKEQRRNNGKKT